MGGDGTLKRSRRYSDNGYGGGDGDGRTACGQVVDDDDFLDGNKDNNQQEIRQRRVDGIILPPTTLLRAQENWWMATANGYQQWWWRGIRRWRHGRRQVEDDEWKTMTTGQEVEGRHGSTTSTTWQEG